MSANFHAMSANVSKRYVGVTCMKMDERILKSVESEEYLNKLILVMFNILYTQYFFLDTRSLLKGNLRASIGFFPLPKSKKKIAMMKIEFITAIKLQKYL